MKKLFVSLMVCFSFSVLFNSCEVEDSFFDESLLIGKWASGTVFYKYLSDHTGKTWDTSDDVTEAEAQPFTWTLVKSELTHIHIMPLTRVPGLEVRGVKTIEPLTWSLPAGIDVPMPTLPKVSITNLAPAPT